MKTYALETTQGDGLGTVRGHDEADAKERWARKQGYDCWSDAVTDQAVEAEIEVRVLECAGHPAGPNDPMGETVYCDGSCR